MCLIFPCKDAADECISYATNEHRGDTRMSQDDFEVIELEILQPLWALFFAMDKIPNVIPFWIDTGLGILPRLAEDSLQHLDKLLIISSSNAGTLRPVSEKERPVYEQLRHRILEYLYRVPLEPSRKQATTSDVYLYANGMAAIYGLHLYLTKEVNRQSVMFSFPFHSTYHIFEHFGAGFKFYGNASDTDLDDLTSWLEDLYKHGDSIQALWCEFPNNPICTAPDLVSLRKLANKYDFFLIVDETVGSFCNVDVTSVADVIVTSLTKSFSGYADVMGGSIVLNPSRPAYPKLKKIVDKWYHNDLYYRDAEVLLSNSADYLKRADIYHRNSNALVKYFTSLMDMPDSPIKKVYYPTTNPSLPLYQRFMRKATPDFKPGYGCLMTVEFNTVDQFIAFFDAVDFFKAPHLGGHCSLLLPYVKGLYADKLDWVAQFDLRETQCRIAPGLEDEEDIINGMKEGMKAVMGEVGSRQTNGQLKGEDIVVSMA
jgi:cystathionine gamma-synthase